ncbi:hypothetical protein CISG_04723 [Coccidioides immitis RMSCC 3703]|uniref:Uncharacterized protein n=1 Tax=Coccidioides immitis RMSCC 3703 TaxID=454286 RepID=A0A0J8QRH5_COCIT|nr:hypothetical protein CISG_04723 [Coccidioides immitis RMSCC 3703]
MPGRMGPEKRDSVRRDSTSLTSLSDDLPELITPSRIQTYVSGDSINRSPTINRLLEIRPWRPVQPRSSRNLTLTRATNLEALLVQAVGSESGPCNRCARELGPFVGCMALEGFLSGSCANCHFNSAGRYCSLRREDRIPRRRPPVRARNSALSSSCPRRQRAASNVPEGEVPASESPLIDHRLAPNPSSTANSAGSARPARRTATEAFREEDEEQGQEVIDRRARRARLLQIMKVTTQMQEAMTDLLRLVTEELAEE